MSRTAPDRTQGERDATQPQVRTEPNGVTRRRPNVSKPGRRRSQPIGILFASPYAVFLVAIFAYPLGIAVYMSFFDWFFAAPGAKVDRPFVGLGNYVTVFSDPAVLRSFLHIAIFLVINVPLTVGLSLVLATSLNAAIPFRTFFRVSFYVPYVTARVAGVGGWSFLLY